MHRLGLGVLLGSLTALAAGCGKKTCGEGTVEKGGACVVGGGPEVAKQIAAQVAAARERVGEIKAAFEEAGNPREDGRVMKELTSVLSAQDKLADKATAVFASSRLLRPEGAALVVQLYAELQLLDLLIEDHLEVAKLDEAAMAAHRAQAEAHTAPEGSLLAEQGYRYDLGIILDNPDEGAGDLGDRVELVELGGVMCGEPAKVSDSGRCPDGESMSAFVYRAKAKGPWIKAQLHIPGSLEPGAEFPLEKVLLPRPNAILAGLVEGNAIAVSEVAYLDRLTRIREHVVDAYEDAEQLEDALARDAAAAR